MDQHANGEMVRLATCIARRGFPMTSLQVHTPDGRTWAIDQGRTGGFRLFEIDLEFRRGPEEHDAADGDAWDLGDLLDYLEAVGRPKARPAARAVPERPAHPNQPPEARTSRASLFPAPPRKDKT